MLLNSFLQNILNKTHQIFQRPEKQTNSTNEMYWLLLLLRNPHLPIPYTFGTRGLVTWHIENLVHLASKYKGNWKIRGCKRRFLTIYSHLFRILGWVLVPKSGGETMKALRNSSLNSLCFCGDTKAPRTLLWEKTPRGEILPGNRKPQPLQPTIES